MRRPRPEELKQELFNGKIYDFFRKSLRFMIRKKYTVTACMVVLLIVSAWAFRFIPQQFMPLLNKQYFTIEMWMPEGTKIKETEKKADFLTELLMSKEGVKTVSS